MNTPPRSKERADEIEPILDEIASYLMTGDFDSVEFSFELMPVPRIVEGGTLTWDRAKRTGGFTFTAHASAEALVGDGCA